MSKNFGHEIEGSPRSERAGAQAAFWVTAVAGIIAAPVMGPVALVVFVAAIVVAWASRPWGEA